MINIWNFWAVRYERLWVQKFSLAPTRRLVLTELRKIIEKLGSNTCDLVDVGCGTGQLIEEIVQELGPSFTTITGIDQAKSMVELAVSKKIPQANFVYGDAECLPFSGGQFDIVTCCHSFPYYRDKLQALKEIARVLKPCGYIFLVNATENTVYDKVVMALVKFTTGRATYPSSKRIAEMLAATGCKVLVQKKLQTKRFMPSIILTISQTEITR